MTLDNSPSQRESGLSPAKRMLLEKWRQGKADGGAIPRRGEHARLPLSYAQERLYYFYQLLPESHLYNLQINIPLRGSLLDVSALERALNEILRRHEALRTTFRLIDGQPFQFISPYTRLDLPVVDLGEFAPEEREERARRLAGEENRRVFDLSADLLLRPLLLRVDESRYVLLLTMHHIVTDGWSVGVLSRELWQLYKAFAKGEPSPLAELPIQYADFALWQRGHLQGALLERQLDYWRQQLAGLPPALDLPADRPRPDVQTFRGARQSFTLAPELTVPLRALAKAEGVTLYMLLLAAFQTLLCRYTQQPDVVVGSPIANRNKRATEDLIGFFANTLVMRTNLSGDPTFREALARVRATATGAYANQDLPFEQLVAELHPERDLSRNPLFQVVFAQQTAQAEYINWQDESLRPLAVESEVTQFDLVLSVIEARDELQGSVVYSTDLFDARSIGRLIGHFETLLRAVVEDPDGRIAELPLLTEAERAQMLPALNVAAPDEAPSIAQLFAARAARTPEAVAVVCGETRLSFAELNGRANRLAHGLLRRGVGAGSTVAVSLGRSAELAVALLGVLKAGAAFAPLDPSWPRAYRREVLSQLKPAATLALSPSPDDFGEEAGLLFSLERERDEIGADGRQDPDVSHEPSRTALVFHVAGRNVPVTNRRLLRRVGRLQNEFGLSEQDVALHHSTPSQESLIVELLWPLSAGARVSLAGGEEAPDASALRRLVAAHGVSLLHLSPPALRAFTGTVEESETPAVESLRRVVCTGEPLRSETVEAFNARFNCPLFYLYSLPEAAAEVAIQHCVGGEAAPHVPLGRPSLLPVYILDAHLQPVPAGVTGEIHLGLDETPVVLPESWGARSEVVANPLAGAPGALLLKTGERARWTADGALEFRGSASRRVWYGGRRVALDEVEAALLEAPSVADAAVLLRENGAGAQELVAYLVTSDGLQPDALRAHLLALLPEYMLPGGYVALSTLPLTAEGRLDEQALIALEVIDAELLGRWEGRLRALPEIEDVAVLARSSARRTASLHLSDLLPDWRPASAGHEASATKERAGADAQDARPESDVPALSEGGPLVLDAGRPRTLPEALRRAALQAHGGGITFIRSDETAFEQTYAALLEDAERVMAGLRAAGLKPQDKVILQLRENQDFIAAFWGCTLGGFVPVPLAAAQSYQNHDSNVGKLHQAWQTLGRPLVLTSRALTGELSALAGGPDFEGLRLAAVEDLRASEPGETWHSPRPEDLALMLFTSGSTGTPKGVMLSHANVVGRSIGTELHDNFSPADIFLNWFPLDHVGGILMYHLTPLTIGARQVQAPTLTILNDPLKWLDLIEKYRVTSTWAPNFAFGLVNDREAEIARRRWDLSSVRFILNGGEAVVARTARRFLQLLAPHGLAGDSMHPAWGMSETSSGCTSSDRFNLETTADDDSFVEVGTPIPGFAVRIVDAAEQLVREGAVGRVQVKGGTVTAGYFNLPEANTEVFTEDGWFNTGDLGLLRGGALTITGRSKDVIIINGANYYSHEVESAAEEVAGLETSYTAACAVRPGGSETDRLAVFFSPEPSAKGRLGELLREVRAQVVKTAGVNVDFLIPVEKEAIPKTAIGKIERAKLRQRFEAGDFDPILKEVDIVSGNANTVPDWFYEVVWRRRDARVRQGSARPGTCLVFLDGAGLGDAVCGELDGLRQDCVRVTRGDSFARLGAARYAVNPHAADDYRQLLSALRAEGREVSLVLHLLTYTGEPAGEVRGPEDLERAQRDGALSLLFLVRALAEDAGGREGRGARLLVVSSDAQPVEPGEKFDYQKSPVLGLVKTIPQELDWLDCRHVDLSGGATARDAAHVLEEMRSVEKEAEVAYRGGRRLVSRLRRADLKGAEKRPLPFKDGGMYLLSGGLGGLGVQVAKYLLTRHRARLLLVGRTPLPERGAWESEMAQPGVSGERIRDYLELESLGGAVRYEAVDVCDLGALREVVADAEAGWRCRLDGVVHLAGVLRENLLVEETEESLSASLRPKVRGAWALHQLTLENPESLFVSFSSVNGYMGGLASAAYSAANRFLDAFAAYRRAAHSARSYSFAWSMWEETGMSRGYGMKQLSQAGGYYSLPKEQGLSSFVVGLHYDRASLLVGLDGGNERVRRHVEPQPAAGRKVSAFYTARAENIPASLLEALEVRDRFGRRSACDFVQVAELPRDEAGGLDVERLASENPEGGGSRLERVAPRNDLERQIANIWQEVLGLPQVGVHDNFFELGGRSMLAIQVIARMRDQLKADIPLRTLFTGTATVAGLAQAVSNLGDLSLTGKLSVADLKRDAILDPSIWPEAELLEASVTNPSGVLLTGSTGFIGAFLLRELLRETDAKIYCLVRGVEGEAEAAERVRTNFAAYMEWDEAAAHRVVPVPGDLARPFIGLSQEKYGELAEEVDVIYHNGAEVNFVLPYYSLRAANVLGTQEILKLAGRSKLKPIHFVSTMAVTFLGQRTVKETALECELEETMAYARYGYVLTKIIGEKLLTAAQGRGFPVSIYRPGIVTGDSRTGAANTKDFAHSLLKSAIMRGRAVVPEKITDMVPVDFVAGAIVHLSRKAESTGKVFHLISPEPLPGAEFADWLLSLGYEIQIVTPDAKRAPAGPLKFAPDDPLSRFASLFEDHQKTAEGMEREFDQSDCTNTLTGLAGSPVACPRLDARYLDTLFSYFLRSGFLPAPERGGEPSRV